jgi:hypothetical protein
VRPSFQPVRNFFESYIVRYYLDSDHAQAGLWTCLGPKYYEHFEIIQDAFDFQGVNDHSHRGLHQALLATRRELGVPDDEWLRLRDRCWIQNSWSATITPKGGFFCEVAGALDLLFDGPGGWPLEPGWWKRGPAEFGEQLEWCEYCSAALDVPLIEANSELDFISPLNLEKLKALGSPKVKAGKYIVLDEANAHPGPHRSQFGSGVDFLVEGGNQALRVSTANRSLSPREFAVFFDNGHPDTSSFPEDWQLLDRARTRLLGFSDRLLIFRGSQTPKRLHLSSLASAVFNPGCLYFLQPSNYRQGNQDTTLSSNRIWEDSTLLMVNRAALSLAGLSQLPLGAALVDRFPLMKRVHLDDFPDFNDLRDRVAKPKMERLAAVKERLSGFARRAVHGVRDPKKVARFLKRKLSLRR